MSAIKDAIDYMLSYGSESHIETAKKVAENWINEVVRMTETIKTLEQIKEYMAKKGISIERKIPDSSKDFLVFSCALFVIVLIYQFSLKSKVDWSFLILSILLIIGGYYYLKWNQTKSA